MNDIPWHVKTMQDLNVGVSSSFLGMEACSEGFDSRQAFSRFWGPDVHDQGAGRVGVGERPAPGWRTAAFSRGSRTVGSELWFLQCLPRGTHPRAFISS